MRLFLVLTIILLSCIPNGDFREYHYGRPQIPFNVNTAPAPIQRRLTQHLPPLIQPQHQQYTGHYTSPNIQSSLIQTYGVAGTAHIARQLPTISYATPPQQYQSHQPSYAGAGAGAGAGGVAASYFTPHQQQYTTNVNPLTHYSNGQQQFGSSGGLGGGGGGGGLGASGGQNGQFGYYISQSESGRLHPYQYQQKPIGDTKPFARQVINCSPNGQCQSANLAPGQPDVQHQSNAAAARAKIEKVAPKCRRIAEAKAQALGQTTTYPHSQQQQHYNVHYSSPQAPASAPHPQPHPHEVKTIHVEEVKLVRPGNRRLFEYTEVELPNDPYN